MINNVSRDRVEMGETRARNLNQSGWLETLNTGEDSISMKWSIDNVAIDGLKATYLSLTFKVNYLESYNSTLFASITDELEQRFETVVITDERFVSYMLGTYNDDDDVTEI